MNGVFYQEVLELSIGLLRTSGFFVADTMQDIRNIAIIAHVDHGKTTLVDALIRQSKTAVSKEAAQRDLIMDSNELEQERGITIFSKNASIIYNDTKINIIDTPGHADFGGEVERVLKMADGSLLLVDAKEGPMPQTRFVLKQALKLGHKIIVVINKIDKPAARVEYVLNKTFDLFLELGADEETAFFPVIYASGRDGKAGLTPDLSTMTDITPLFDEIIKHIPAPRVDIDKPLQMLVASLAYDNFKGRIGIGRIYSGKISSGSEVTQIKTDGGKKTYRITSLSTFVGLERKEVDEVVAGDIAAVSGIADITIGETIADIDNPVALPPISVEEPTVKMVFGVNTSPFAGKEGEFKTASQIAKRLHKELETDVALAVVDRPAGDWEVSGRGELHLAILIERLRREGYEFQVSKPHVIIKEIDGVTCVPFERLFIEVPEEYSGTVIQKIGERHGEMVDMKHENGTVHLVFIITTEELFGFRNQFLSDTKGLGIMNTIFEGFLPDKGNHLIRSRGSLVAFEGGETRLYGLTNVQDRGILFVGPGEFVYKGQVVGQNARSDDMRVNVCKEKKLSNQRSVGEGVSVHFNQPRRYSLDEALEYIDDSELVEVTPKSVRIRKVILDELEERRKISQGK